MGDYSLKDDAAVLFNLNKGRNLHNTGCKSIKNPSELTMRFETIMNDPYSGIDIHGKNFYLNFFNSDIPSIKNLYNQYIANNGMKIFIPINIPNPYHIIKYIHTFGPENIGYVIFGDCIVPNFLTYEDKLTLLQLPS
jgi:hypothetical protein